jgi:hypothetical protein
LIMRQIDVLGPLVRLRPSAAILFCRRGRSSRRFCSPACRSEHARASRRQREEYDAALAEIHGLGLLRGPSTREMRAQRPSATCPACGRTWWISLQKRSDATYWSARCRTAAWRERNGMPRPGWRSCGPVLRGPRRKCPWIQCPGPCGPGQWWLQSRRPPRSGTVALVDYNVGVQARRCSMSRSMSTSRPRRVSLLRRSTSRVRLLGPALPEGEESEAVGVRACLVDLWWRFTA